MIEAIQSFCKTNLFQYSEPHIILRDDLKKNLNIIYLYWVISSILFFNPNFEYMFLACVLTVFTEIKSLAAISLLGLPSRRF